LLPSGTLLLLQPVDLIWWSEATAATLRRLARNDAPRRLVITGRLTSRARDETAALEYVAQEGYGVEAATEPAPASLAHGGD